MTETHGVPADEPSVTREQSRRRTGNYLRQIATSLAFKVGAIGASFCAVPLMIRYLGQERYGVWATLLGVISWAVFFDFGIGNGLRNKVAETLAKNDRPEAARYISSGYTLIAGVGVLLWVGLLIASVLVPWQQVFNTTSVSAASLRATVQVTGSFILLNFWVGLVGPLLGSVQKTAMVSAGQLISNLFSLACVFLLWRLTTASILWLGWAYGFSLVAANAVLTVFFFGQNADLRPRLSMDKRHVQPILSVGFQFFTIQIAVLVIFTTDKMLITQFFGPEQVTAYDVVFKIFSIITFLHTLVSAPLWSAYTDAYHRDDMAWIRKMLGKQMGLFVGFLVMAVALASLARPLIALWVGTAVQVDSHVVAAMAVFTVVSTWNNVFGMPLGGMGKIRLGSIYTLFSAALNLPLAYFLAVILRMGTAGIVVATTLSIAASSFISPMQIYYFVFAKRRNPFWEAVLR